jgi:chromosome partitioning protein
LPETVELIALENHIRERNKREQVLIDEILPHLKDYQAIIFDTPPSWNFLIMNALVASRHVISPVGCDLGSLQALTTNLNTLTEFKSRMKLDWDTFLLVPTLLQRTKLSSQIQSAYVSKYKEQVTAGTIRRAVKGEESLAFQESVIENNSKSEIAQDYYQIIQELWQTFLDAEKRRGN